ncbi:DegT/DnrJ/EryC1/StrS family aminotransferase [Acidiferrobacter sp.]|jgi:dTDP-4-amino-4,6-dideoxygalactose transaminase|uniref:DegT/DnrJ/EryC1/StrS family aminotransferase n=1 Tax=Acidiferrobacter sp. TaxID=1872107 RepID=UPI00261B950A|nr:DegT/DnrJ/EryC1/StrS family aminotransferase [Acidiferrobacter sp.]
MTGFRIPAEAWDITAADRERMQAMAQEHPLTQEAAITAFETQIAVALGRRHAVACANAACGLEAVLKAHGIGPGDEIIVSAYSWHEIAREVWRAGATPVFSDIDYWSGTLNPEKAARKIGPAARAMLIANTNGHPADWEAFRTLGERHGLVLIEDSTEALGSAYDETPVGRFGDASLFDFRARGPVACGGGGMVLTDDARVAESLRQNLGGMPHAPLSAHTAVLLQAQWGRLDATLSARAHVAELYARHIRSFEGIKDPYTAPRVTAHHPFTFLVHLGARFSRFARDAIVDDLRADGIEARPYATPLYRDGQCRQKGFAGAGCGITDKIADRGIVLPFHAGLAEADIAVIVEAVKDASINVGAGSAIYL